MSASEEQVQITEVSEVGISEKVIDNIDALAHPDKYPEVMYCSIPGPSKDASFEEKLDYTANILRMTSKADEQASSQANMRINLVHVLAHKVMLRDTDQETGEIRGTIPADRLVLLDDEGRTYQAVSQGLMASLRLLFTLMGTPDTWAQPVPVMLQDVALKNGRHTFKLVIWQEKKGGKK